MESAIELRSSKNILIVEDDMILSKNLEIMLQSLGHTVSKRLERADAVNISVDLNGVDMIFLDINLPGKINGVQFADLIKKTHKIPIIYITGNSEESTFNEASKTLMHGFIPKPFTRDQLNYSIKLSDLRLDCENMIRTGMETLARKEKILAIGEMAGGIIHDLGNFNGIVLGSFQLIERLTDVDDINPNIGSIKKSVSRGRAGAQRISELAIRYRKLIKTSEKIEFKDVKFVELFEEISYYFNSRFTQNNIDFRINTSDKMSANTSEIILLQAIINLISNSLYELKSDTHQDKWIELRAYQKGDVIMIDIIDSGKGVSEENIPKLFSSDFTTKNFNSDDGTGMGLYFVKCSINKYLEGDLSYVAGEPNTTFRITLPAK